MKVGIHPEYYVVTAKCACGNTFMTRSVKKAVQVEICSSCHPFFTGKERFVDTEGRIDKFAKKFELSKANKTKDAAKKKASGKTAVKHKTAGRIETSTGDKKKAAKVLSSRPKAS